MGDLAPGPGVVEGPRFQATCFSREEAIALAGRCGVQYEEHGWLAARLREAASAWPDLADQVVVVIVREVFAGSATDEEVLASLREVPPWLLGT
jgi:hypothetical protein